MAVEHDDRVRRTVAVQPRLQPRRVADQILLRAGARNRVEDAPLDVSVVRRSPDCFCKHHWAAAFSIFRVATTCHRFSGMDGADLTDVAHPMGWPTPRATKPARWARGPARTGEFTLTYVEASDTYRFRKNLQ